MPQTPPAQRPTVRTWTFEPVAGPFTFTEGPVWDGATLRFTDIRAGRIMRFDPRTGACDAIAEDTNRANGLALDREGRLIVCEGGGRPATSQAASASPSPTRSRAPASTARTT